MANDAIPYGLCQCGCGEKTGLSPYTDAKWGYVKGEPRNFRPGHGNRGKKLAPRVIFDPPNPSGLCMCGCGRKTPIAERTHSRVGVLAGHPRCFVLGHTLRRPCAQPVIPDQPKQCACGCGGLTNIVRGRAKTYVVGHNAPLRLIVRSDYTVADRGFYTDCWIWNHSAGMIGVAGKKTLVYRAMWEQQVGPIPAGLVIDHLCRQRECIRPAHLEPVTQTENIRRGKTSKLSLEKAAEIRRLRDEGITHRELAFRFAVGKTTIGSVLAGTSWNHD